MTDKDEQIARITAEAGFVGALDQSGGSTPKALLEYGVPENAYKSEDEMFGLIQAMRERVITSPAFASGKILAAILFERTMRSQIQGEPATHYLWKRRRIAPFLKVDQGLEELKDGVKLMKPIPGLEALLVEAAGLGVVGTKMRSLIELASPSGVDQVVNQQFEVAAQISRQGLLPIIEPEISIDCPEEAAAEDLLLGALRRRLDALPRDQRVILKLTLPTRADFYAELVAHDRVARVLALSGGYTRAEACQRLADNHGVIASFSRALLEGLRVSDSDAAFNAVLTRSVDQIYQASVIKTDAP